MRAGLSAEAGPGSTGRRRTPYHRATVMKRPFTEARLLTVNEVADLLRVSRMTVYRLIKEGQISALRVGRNYRLREDDVDTYLSGRYTEAG
jgi:excisionase family DNA binding protein